MKRKRNFTVSDGELVLEMESAEEGGYIVTSPFEPELITDAGTLKEAFAMAHVAMKGLHVSRAKIHRKLALAKGTP